MKDYLNKLTTFLAAVRKEDRYKYMFLVMAMELLLIAFLFHPIMMFLGFNMFARFVVYLAGIIWANAYIERETRPEGGDELSQPIVTEGDEED